MSENNKFEQVHGNGKPTFTKKDVGDILKTDGSETLKVNGVTLTEKESDSENMEFTTNIDMPSVRTETEKIKFTSTFSTYMTLIGFSVGMSDFWRFPFLAYRNGGGAFIIPFVVMIIVCGFPLYFLEYSLSKFSGRGPYKIWDVCPIFRGVGVTIVTAYALWMIGTTVMRCWIIDFLINSFREPLPWTLCTNSWNTPNCQNLMERNGTPSSIPASLTNQSFNGFTNFNVTDSLVILAPNMIDAEYIINGVTNVSGTPMTSEEEFWQYRVLELSSGMSDLSPVQWRHIITLVVVRIVIFFGLIKSIKSIEKIIYVTATVPFLLTVAIFIRSLMLPGSSVGLLHFISPDFHKIIQPRVWIEATLMAFYTLGFGWGGNMLLGSHAHFHENCLRTSIFLPLANMFMAVFSGLVCFSVLGNMAYSYNVEVTEVINAGMSVGIVAYITALSALPVPQVWTVCFLTAIILTGIDGQLVPMDMIMQLIGDLFPKLRRGFRIHALVVVAVIFFICSLPTCTGAGAYIFLWMDWYNGAWIGPIVAFIQLVVVAWTYGMDRFSDDVHMMIGRPIPAALRIMTAFVAPFIVLVIFITSCVEYAPPKYGTYSYSNLATVMGWMSVVLVMSPMVIQGFWMVYRAKGSFSKNVLKFLQPNDHWGPSEEEFHEDFHVNKIKYKNRTLSDLLYFNIFGKYPRTSDILTSKSYELNGLTSQNHK